PIIGRIKIDQADAKFRMLERCAPSEAPEPGCTWLDTCDRLDTRDALCATRQHMGRAGSRARLARQTLQQKEQRTSADDIVRFKPVWLRSIAARHVERPAMDDAARQRGASPAQFFEQPVIVIGTGGIDKPLPLGRARVDGTDADEVAASSSLFDLRGELLSNATAVREGNPCT